MFSNIYYQWHWEFMVFRLIINRHLCAHNFQHSLITDRQLQTICVIMITLLKYCVFSLGWVSQTTWQTGLWVRRHLMQRVGGSTKISWVPSVSSSSLCVWVFTVWLLVIFISSSDVMWIELLIVIMMRMQEIVDQKLSARVEDLLMPIGIHVSLYFFVWSHIVCVKESHF